MYLHEDKSVFKQVIQQVSEMSGSTEEFVEKDYYVTMFLRLLAEQIPEAYRLASFEMQVQSLERTLADKIFAICDYYILGKSTRYSRHLYDIHKLMSKVELDEEFRELVKAVRLARTSKENCPSAKDGVDVPKLIQAIIDESYFKSDYEGLTSKILYEQIDYDVAVDSLKKFLETEVV